MKRAFVLALVMLLLLPVTACCEDLTDAVNSTVDQLDLSSLGPAGSSLEPLFSQTGGLRETIRAIAQGKLTLSFEQVMQLLASRFVSSVSASLWRLTRLAAPALLWAMLRRLSGASQECGQVMCALLVCAFLTQDLSDHLTLSTEAVERMSTGMQGLFPLLLTLMTVVGGAGGSALMQPAVVAAAGAMTGLIKHVTLPLATGAAVMTMLAHLGTGIKVQRLSALLYQASAWALGICFTVFIGVLATRGVTAAALDGVTIRTAKYAIDHLIPVVGGMFADTVDALVGSGLLVQSALGVTGLVLILSMMAGPLCQTLAAALMYKLAAALMQPVADGSLADCIDDFGRILMLLFIIQLCAAAMFLMLIAQVIAVSGMTMMLR